MDVLIFLGIVASIIYLLSKRESVRENQGNYFAHEEEINFETVDPKPVVIGKNKWLYPAEDFGKMEEGLSWDEGDNKEKRFKKL